MFGNSFHKKTSIFMETISLRSLEDCKLVQTGRKCFESMDGRKDEEKEKNLEGGRKLSKIAEKIKVFEKKVKMTTTPMKKRRNQDRKEKITPISGVPIQWIAVTA
jgi:hypothetical protein